RALDQLDLLVKLRDLLACDRAVRGQLQQLFDHVFVDEFQDTDPLQAEIVLYLCEMVPEASRWEDVALRPGSLTLAAIPSSRSIASAVPTSRCTTASAACSPTRTRSASRCPRIFAACPR